MPNIPKGADLVNMIAGHYEAILGFYGTDLGCAWPANIWGGTWIRQKQTAKYGAQS